MNTLSHATAPELQALLALSTEFGKGFDVSNLRHMRSFYLLFQMWDAVRRELRWPHHRMLLRVDGDGARQSCMNEAAVRNWSSRALERERALLVQQQPTGKKIR